MNGSVLVHGLPLSQPVFVIRIALAHFLALHSVSVMLLVNVTVFPFEDQIHDSFAVASNQTSKLSML